MRKLKYKTRKKITGNNLYSFIRPLLEYGDLFGITVQNMKKNEIDKYKTRQQELLLEQQNLFQ